VWFASDLVEWVPLLKILPSYQVAVTVKVAVIFFMPVFCHESFSPRYVFFAFCVFIYKDAFTNKISQKRIRKACPYAALNR